MTAGEHHVGTLDLSGEGNRVEVASPVSDAMVEAGIIAAGHTTLHGHRVAQTRATLEAAYPAIREQVAEEIAVAIAEAGDERSKHRDHDRPAVSRLGSVRHASKIAREIGGKA